MALEQLLVIGIYHGSVYALLALGYSLVYGVGGIMNLSHGMLYIFTSYLLFWFGSYFGLLTLGYFSLEYLGLILLSICIIVLIGALVYLIVIKPLQDKPVTILIITFALGMFIEQLVKVVMKETTIILPDFIAGNIEVLGVQITMQQVIVIVASAITVVLFILFINKTKVGNSIRAISQDKEAAQLMGINVNRYLMYTLMISAFLAAFASVINAGVVTPMTGWQYLTTAFSVVILGGLGSLWGSVIAAYILAFITQGVSIFYSPEIAPLVPVFVIIVMLIIRPQGLFGKKERS